MIGHNQRLAPLHVKAKQILQSGIIGRIVTFRTVVFARRAGRLEHRGQERLVL
jgi:predicted dehydrogenase